VTGTVTALVVLLLSLAASYFFCIRPMREGHCAMGQLASGTGTGCRDRPTTDEVARLTAEITALRTQSAQPDAK